MFASEDGEVGVQCWPCNHANIVCSDPTLSVTSVASDVLQAESGTSVLEEGSECISKFNKKQRINADTAKRESNLDGTWRMKVDTAVWQARTFNDSAERNHPWLLVIFEKIQDGHDFGKFLQVMEVLYSLQEILNMNKQSFMLSISYNRRLSLEIGSIERFLFTMSGFDVFPNYEQVQLIQIWYQKDKNIAYWNLVFSMQPRYPNETDSAWISALSKKDRNKILIVAFVYAS